ncbi:MULTISPECIES: cyclase family protein [Clostridium]|uniref:Kynurenine formamidase n=4 Tax=Clostridium TaxID=1485 RepID=D8GLC5_CLOLD|nr:MULTISPECIES: cyclase family protein [Clostridium]ADK15484.1 putative cyclase [Clostridium ljungdahlii DSM 13528]AGY74713.1 cyclase family protein [Clostridium autoethanogenum DSM 10061]ALU34894.1 Cyclase family protein [Clostridium autoethanogenum DSM 10061]OAA85516.1 Kynurenine formamidase [Clostridium ljungdahlii DSM 13528]OAA93831.1 Kynurenine formamidase [Clostridium coskatii]
MTNSLWNTLSDLKKHQWVDLTHEFGPDTPRFASFNPAKFETIFTHKDGFFVKQYTFAGQYGTHLDPPVHFAEGGRYIDELELQELVLPLVVIDLSEKVKENDDYVLTVDDILEWEKKYGKIPEGSFVAFRSDWSKRWPDQDKLLNLDKNGDEHYPGWSIDALKFLYETRKIAANGHETFDTDAPIEQKTTGFQGEYYVLKEDHYQIEVMTNLDKVPPTGAIIFSIVPKAQKAPGFPVRSFAILP